MSAAGGIAFERYRTGSSDEWLMRIGGGDRAPILFVPPLFEEMNRTRALMVTAMRLLAAEGHSSWLVDLPGTGESSLPLESCSWTLWRNAVRDAADHVAAQARRRPVTASLRGGALLDDAADAEGHWRFAPAQGSSLARDMVRSAMLKADELTGPIVNLAGYLVPEPLLAELRAAAPAPVARSRTVRLETDPGEADTKIEGPALWRRSEPSSSPQLANAIAGEIAGFSS